MPRHPTKNLVNMHDIVAQPLTAIPDAVDAVLRRPEPLDELEVQSIFTELSYILLRVDESLAAKDGNAFCALFKLLSEGLAHSETSFDHGVRVLLENRALLDKLHAIFRAVVEQEALPLHSAGMVELVQVLSSLCDSTALKDTGGALFMRGFAKLLQLVYANVEEARRHFHVQRGTATALINLVKGSKQNKQRLASWKFMADCCAASVDVFFQLQCVEMLFRVSRQNKDVLAHLGGSLPSAIIEELRGLPNDGTLLSRMSQLTEHLNEGRAEVLRYPLKEVVAAATTLTSSTSAFFTPHYVIVMVTAASADNVTVPYRIIRSITLGRDGRVIIKLEEFPVKLEGLLSHTTGMDVITFRMTPADLARFKQSPVRQWIMDALKARKEEQRQSTAPPMTARRSPDSTTKSAAASGGDGTSRDAANSAAVGATTAEEVREESARKKARVEGTTTTAAPSPNWDGASVGSRHPSTAALLHVVDALVAQAGTANEAQAVLLQLRHHMETKKELQRGRLMEMLNEAMAHIQDRVDDTRRTAKEDRTAWHESMLEDLERVEGQVMAAQEKTAQSVEQLNEDLKRVRSSNQAINERIACMEVELTQTLEELRGEELRWTEEIQGGSAREVARVECELDQQLINRGRPLSLISEYMRQSATRQ